MEIPVPYKVDSSNVGFIKAVWADPAIQTALSIEGKLELEGSMDQ